MKRNAWDSLQHSMDLGARRSGGEDTTGMESDNVLSCECKRRSPAHPTLCSRCPTPPSPRQAGEGTASPSFAG